MKIKILLLFYLLISTVVFSQSSRFYGLNQLSNNFYTALCQDKQGFIWIGTEYGLYRFDGIQFVNYLNDEKDDTSLLENHIRSLTIDKEGRLWVGCNIGLQYYEPDKDAFQTITFPNNLSPCVLQITQIHTGDYLIATSGYGLFKLEKTAIRASKANLDAVFINSIFEDSSDRIWVSTIQDGLFCFQSSIDGDYICYTNTELSGVANSILEDGNGRILINTNSSICRYDETAKKFISLPTENNETFSIRCMLLGHGGSIHIGTGKGLMYIDSQTDSILPKNDIYTQNFDQRKAKVVALLEDDNQNLWVAYLQRGLLMLPKEEESFDFWNFTNRRWPDGIITSVFHDPQENSIWIGTEDKGLLNVNEKGELLKQVPFYATAISFFKDSENTYWVGTYYNGLAKLNTRNNTHAFFPQLKDGRVKSITEDGNKNLYISVFGEGFLRYHLPTGKIDIFNTNQEENRVPEFFNDWVNIMHLDSDGLLWLGHYKGISCFDTHKQSFLPIACDSTLSTHVCYSLLEGKHNTLWVGTNNGLFKINKETFSVKQYTTTDGLSNNIIYGLASDKNGNIWCSTLFGINKLDIAQEKFFPFYTSNGSIDKGYIRGGYCQSPQGTIYFAGNEGITCFDPTKIQMGTFDREVVCTNLYLSDNKPAIPKKTLSGGKYILTEALTNARELYLTYEDNTFTLEFSTLDFLEAENIYYEYRLKGLDNHWSSTLQGVNRITYNHLNPSQYTLEVRACLNGQVTHIKSISIYIAAPWYQTVWAYIIYCLLGLAIVVPIFYLIKRKRQAKVNEEKLRFFINIAHEIRSPMTLVISPLKKLLTQQHDENTANALQSMHKNASRIVNLLNQLLDIRKIDKGQMQLKYSETNLIPYIKELMQMFDYESGKRNIRLIFECEQEELKAWIDCNNFDKILLNILSNAFKYTPDNGEIGIKLNVKNNSHVEISISDTGIGLDEEKLGKIFDRFYQIFSDTNIGSIGFGIGLNLCKMLVNLHHGTISAVNRKDRQGSIFSICIPLGNRHLKEDELIEKPIRTERIVLYENPRRTLSEEKQPGKAKSNYKILVIDDDQDIRDFLSKELSRNYKVFLSADGNDGWEMALRLQPDLIISDVVMPKMDGLTLVKKLKSNNNVNHIPIILLTAKTEHHDRISGIEKGIDAYLAKPFHTDELESLIANLINNRLRLKGKFSGRQAPEDKIKKPAEMKSSDELLMEKVIAIINENLENPELSVEFLSEKIGLSRVHLYRKLKDMTGISGSEFVRNIRMKQAATLLRERKISISQVAYTVGFTNSTHFSSVFKKYYGLSPTEYIEQGK